jgi:DNA-binding CsgD family transcriptional regulator
MAKLLRGTGVAEPALMPWIPDCIEAMISVGDTDSARDLLAWYGSLVQATGRASARVRHTRCESLLAAGRGDLVAASALIERAVAGSLALPYPLEHGRNLLIKGSVERRRKLKSAARQSVTEAADVFDHIGAHAWAERARQELRRLEPSRSGPHGLTALEARVAEHVLDRLSAREMAAQLFVSRRTIEGTLGRLYTRYGVHSRAELRSALVDAVSVDAAVDAVAAPPGRTIAGGT